MRRALVTTFVRLGAATDVDVAGAHLVLAVHVTRWSPHAREIVAADEVAS